MTHPLRRVSPPSALDRKLFFLLIPWCVLGGCSPQATTSNPERGETSSEAKMEISCEDKMNAKYTAKERLDMHNYRSVDDDPDWELEAWMAASSYDPGERMRMSFHLVQKTEEMTREVPKLAVQMAIVLKGDKGNQVESSHEITPDADAKMKRGWIARIDNLFPVKGAQEHSSIVSEGHYLINVEVVINKQYKYHFNNIPVEVLKGKK
jgi:hypothetical protein